MSFLTESTRLSRNDFIAQVVAGKVPGYSYLFKIGNNPNIPNGVNTVDIWGGGGLYTGQPATGLAEKIHVFSNNAADTSAGTGAQTIVLYGLDDLFQEQMEVVTMNGVTPVLTTKFWRRMNKAIVLTTGTANFNVGTITARHQTTITNVFMVMQPGTNETHNTAYTIPAGKTGFLGEWRAFLTDAQATYGRMTGFARPFGAAWRSVAPISLHREQNLFLDFKYGLALPEKTDLRVSCLEVSSDNTSISSSYTMLLIDNNKLT